MKAFVSISKMASVSGNCPLRCYQSFDPGTLDPASPCWNPKYAILLLYCDLCSWPGISRRRP